jgi:hypothetical protein
MSGGGYLKFRNDRGVVEIRIGVREFNPDSPDGSGRQDQRPRKRWRNRRFLLSPVGSVRIRLLDLS